VASRAGHARACRVDLGLTYAPPPLLRREPVDYIALGALLALVSVCSVFFHYV